MKRGLLILLLATVAYGCKEPPPPPRPTPTPTPTPEPLGDVIAFTEAGGLHAVAWKGDQHRTIFSDRSRSVWFPSAANTPAQGLVGPAGHKGPHFIAWLSGPGGVQNVVRIYLNGELVPLTSISAQAKPEMKNIRLGNAPVYSHDGKRIAYSHNGDIWIMDHDGYNATTLIADGSSWSPAWSHDDKRIAYVNIYEGRSDLWVTNIDDRDTYQVTDFDSYQVGQPRFTPGDKRIMLTRIQQDESDVVSVISRPDIPLADAEPITRDRQSGNAILAPDDLRIVYASGPLNPFKPADPKTLEAHKDIDPLTLYVWRAMPDGKKPQRLAEARGLSPAWLRPDIPTPTPEPTVAGAKKPPKTTAPPRATQVAAKPTAAAKPDRPDRPTPAPTAVPTRRPTPMPTRVAQRPTPAVRQPTQPAPQAAALKLRLAVAFEGSSDAISLSSLGSVKKIAGRARQYPANLIRVYGPLDTSPLRGAYPSPEARSKARAQKVAEIIAKDKGVDVSQIKTVPYLPQGVSSRSLTNGVEIYMNLKK